MPEANRPRKNRRFANVRYKGGKPKSPAGYSRARSDNKAPPPFSKEMISRERKSHPVLTQINTSWFKTELLKSGVTQRALAGALNLDPSGVSLLLNGRRRIQMAEALVLAKLIGVSLDVVLMNAGAVGAAVGFSDTDSDISRAVFGDGKGTLEVSGFIGEGFKVFEGPPRGPKQVPAIQGVSNDRVKVLRVQTAGTSNGGLDGALIYYRDMGAIDASSLGKAAIISVKGDGQSLLRIARRGYTDGRYDLTTLGGETTHEDVVLAAINPVLWIKI